MKNNHEILAPAGTFEALEAAVQNGANAVYLSGKDFGARKFAGNFDRDELKQAVTYCHVRGVNFYVTVNTLVFNHEMDGLKEYLDFLYTVGVDAVIVQDMGVLHYIRKHYPDLDVHCSTQMSVQSVEDIKLLESFGVKRVVLGREMSLEQIRQAKEETAVELEVFVHGALCISVSGQCLMSSMIGGRSGNRGRCAQPCRQKYSLYNEDTDETLAALHGDYLLSPKDLSTLEEINQVLEAGAHSLKIEGRMKKPEYVAKVVKAYRQVVDAAVEQRNVEMSTLKKELSIFNRGFTKGHLFGENGLSFMSMVSPGNQGTLLGVVKGYDAGAGKITLLLEDEVNHNDEIQLRRKGETVGGRVERLEQGGRTLKSCNEGETCQINFKYACKVGEKVYKTYDEALMKEARDSYHKEFLSIPVTIDITIKAGEPVKATLSDGLHRVTDVSQMLPQAAMKRAITKEDVEAQLSKLGGTPYDASEIHIHLEEGLALPMKALNEIRRSLVEQLNQQRSNRYKRSTKLSDFEVRRHGIMEDTNKHQQRQIASSVTLTYGVKTLGQLEKLLEIQEKLRALQSMTIYYNNLESLSEAVDLMKGKGSPSILVPKIPRMATEIALKKYFNIISELKLETVLVQNLGHLIVFKDFKLMGDFNLNVINDLTYGYYRDKGLMRITLSPELTLSQMADMNLQPETTEIIGFGALPVMSMKHCVISSNLGQPGNCQLCHQHRYSLVDRMSEHFPIRKGFGCTTDLYNSKKLMMIEDHEKLRKAGIAFFRLNFLDETPKEVEEVVILHQHLLKSTLSNDDEKVRARLKANGVTNGHLYRGIE